MEDLKLKKMKSKKKSDKKSKDKSDKKSKDKSSHKVSITNEDTWDIINNYFSLGEVQLVKHQLTSFNDFVDNHIEKIISGPQYNPLIIDIEAPPEDEDQKLGENVKFLRHEIRFSKVYLHKPYHQETNGSITPIFPNEARLRSLTYQSELFSDISHVVKTLDENHEEIEEYASVNIVKNRIGAIPIMLGSNICVLSDISKMSYKSISEDPVDPGGYFIINGGEKVVIAQERMNDNHIYLYHNKNGKYPYTCENRSSRDQPGFTVMYI